MPFRFSLAEVLEHRERIEEMRRREMDEARRETEYVEDLLKQADGRREACRRDLAASVEAGESFARQELFANYLQGLDRLIRRTQEHLAMLRRELEKRRRRLAEAARGRQVLEELEEEERKAYLMEERRREMREFDEIAIRNYLTASREKNA